MENDNKAAARPRSKAMRYILIILVVAYFWATKYELWFSQNQIIRYNKWTSEVSLVTIPNLSTEAEAN